MTAAGAGAGGRAGVTMVESLVALLVGLFLVQLALQVGAMASTRHREVLERAERVASVRTVSAVLRGETAAGVPGVDWGFAGDSLWVRAFRGVGLVCGAGGAEAAPELVVAYTGYRRPDPSKDSVLAVYPDGTRRGVPLAAATAGVAPCAGDGELPLVVTLGGAVPPGAVAVRVFERGIYALSAAALRYRRGAGGRQPLTPEHWAGATGWREVAGRLEAELVPVPPSGVRAPRSSWWVPLHAGRAW